MSIGNITMNKSTVTLLAITIVVTLGCITALLITGHDGTTFIAAVPGTLAAIYALAGFDKSKNAEANSAVTKSQTNGRLTELIASNQQHAAATQALADAITNNPGIPVAAAAGDDGTVLTTSTLPAEGSDPIG